MGQGTLFTGAVTFTSHCDISDVCLLDLALGRSTYLEQHSGHARLLPQNFPPFLLGLLVVATSHL
jgi:hypothetical protein